MGVGGNLSEGWFPQSERQILSCSFPTLDAQSQAKKLARFFLGENAPYVLPNARRLLLSAGERVSAWVLHGCVSLVVNDEVLRGAASDAGARDRSAMEAAGWAGKPSRRDIDAEGLPPGFSSDHSRRPRRHRHK